MPRRFWAPGRVNLMGDHTDYSGGLVLPAAIDRGVVLDVEPAAQISLRSTRFEGAVHVPADGSVAPASGWGRYVTAVAGELAALGRPPVGLAGVVHSNLPAGAGLSSSAALEVAVALALCAVADFPLDALTLAQACQRAEHRAVGVPSGVMDQAASLLGRADTALLLDCGTLDHRLVPLPADLALLVVDSGVTRELEASGYAQRRMELDAGLVALQQPRPSEAEPDEVDALIATLDAVQARRVRHVVMENARVRDTAAVLESGADRDALGRLFAASHASLRHDFEVTVPETDLLVELCLDAGASAARMTGGGFGGAVVALVDTECIGDVEQSVITAYARRYGQRKATALRCRACDGAKEQ
jgi:galactokinase